MLKNLLIPVPVKLDVSNRFDLPIAFRDQHPWKHASENDRIWILLMSVGKFRFLSDEEVEKSAQLEPIRKLIMEGPPLVVLDPTSADPERDVIATRLLPVEVGAHGKSWRIKFPRAFNLFTPSLEFLMFFSLDGHCELWRSDVVRNATDGPFDSGQ